jgi:hypothetical protein
VCADAGSAGVGDVDGDVAAGPVQPVGASRVHGRLRGVGRCAGGVVRADLLVEHHEVAGGGHRGRAAASADVDRRAAGGGSELKRGRGALDHVVRGAGSEAGDAGDAEQGDLVAVIESVVGLREGVGRRVDGGGPDRSGANLVVDHRRGLGLVCRSGCPSRQPRGRSTDPRRHRRRRARPGVGLAVVTGEEHVVGPERSSAEDAVDPDHPGPVDRVAGGRTCAGKVGAGGRQQRRGDLGEHDLRGERALGVVVRRATSEDDGLRASSMP